MSPDHESDWFDRLKARIEEHIEKDLQALARAKEERDKLVQAKSEDNEQPPLET